MKYPVPLIERHTSIKKAIQLIDRTNFDTALVVNEQGIYLGGIFINDLRRLLISGVNEEDEIGAYPVKYNYGISELAFKDAGGLKTVLSDMRLHGVKYVPILTVIGEIEDVVSVDDLEESKLKEDHQSRAPEVAKRVLVVGGAGYLGSVLTRRLLARGYHVRVLDSFIYGKRSLEDLIPNDRLEVVEGDLRNIHTCVTSLEGVNASILLAAIVGDPASKVRPTDTIETNVLATQALASACKLQHINRFIYASTCSVYGVGEGVLDETTVLNPVSLYARTKIASEKIITSMGDEYFSPTILRMGTLYGYSPRMRFDLVVNTMTMKSFTQHKIAVFGGRQWRPLLSVDDAADAYIQCLEADIDDVGNQVFNVGSNDQNYQIDDIAHIISHSLGGIPIDRDHS
ncbi:MAG: NAD-dependent epimerase/dehydratase family protein, partial [Anaerolineae bacterium]|nr:NAD-dependent epimerase/dehydratase family protein [Anaerolineae bacterium]